MNLKELCIVTTIFYMVMPDLNCFSQTDFYYFKDSKIFLEVLKEAVVIKFDSKIEKNKIYNFLKDKTSIKRYEQLKQSYAKDYFKIYLQPGKDFIEEINKTVHSLDIESMENIYIDSGIELIPFDNFIIKFKMEIDTIRFLKFNELHGVEIVKTKVNTNNKYRMRLNKSADLSLLDMAKLYYESFPLEYSIPDFIRPIQTYSLNDTYFLNQYYLHNIGQTQGVVDADIDALEAWGISTGSSSITVAVLDEGGVAHEDLPFNRIVQGYDFVELDSDPTPEANSNHGMACAGIIAASQNNNIGITGIAPNSKVMYLKIIGVENFASDAYIAEAIEYAYRNGADIISNSWGANSSNPNYIPIINEAIDSAINFGRGGKGALLLPGQVMLASRPTSMGYVIFPANSPNVLAVGAIDKSNMIQYYSPRDTEIDIVAPSGLLSTVKIEKDCGGGDDNKLTSTVPPEPIIPYYEIELKGDVWTIDYPGQRGWNNGVYSVCEYDNFYKFIWQYPGGDSPSIGNYTAHFGGTSASCPQAAGVAALVLSLNSQLTELQVRNIIKQSADDMGAVGFDTDFGYGRLNAYQALLLTHAYSNKSITYNTTSINSQRKIVRDGSGNYHIIFTSGGEV